MNKEILNEISSMKYMFGYKRGVVISEQELTQKQIEASNAGWGPVSDEYAKTLPVGTDGKIIPKELPQNSAPAQTTKTTQPAKKGYEKPNQLKDVKHFQDWLDAKYPGWVSKYGKLESKPERGYGKYGPNTSRAWSTHKDEYLKNPEIPKTNQPVQNQNDNVKTSTDQSLELSPEGQKSSETSNQSLWGQQNATQTPVKPSSEPQQTQNTKPLAGVTLKQQGCPEGQEKNPITGKCQAKVNYGGQIQKPQALG